MKKITGQFTKYTVILLIVGAVLVLIGGLSVGRKAIANQREIALDMTAKTRVDVISKENTQLKTENAQLKKDIEQIKNEKNVLDEKVKTFEAYLLLHKYIEEQNIEKAKQQLSLVHAELLPVEHRETYNKIVEYLARQ